MEGRRRPLGADGSATTPAFREANRLEGVCGSRSVVIAGKTRPA
jgi:hypothetical protein